MATKIILTISLFLSILFVKGQDEIAKKTDFILPFKSKVLTDNKPCKNVIINIYHADDFNTESDTNNILQTIYLKPDGILTLEIPGDVSYIIEITKKGYIHKRFKVNTEDVPNENRGDDFAGFNVESFELSKPIKGVNYNLFNHPLILIEFNYEMENFYYNEKYSDLALAAISNLKELENKQLLINKGQAELSESKNTIILLSVGFSILCFIIIGLLIYYKRK